MFNRNLTASSWRDGRPAGRGRPALHRLSLGALLVALLVALCVLPACTINANDKGQDGEKRVDIKSPVGDLHVSEQADIRDAGLTLYPGAKPAPKEDGDDKKSANVNLSLPGFSPKKSSLSTPTTCRDTASRSSATAAGTEAT